MVQKAHIRQKSFGDMLHSDVVRNAKIVGVAIKTTLELAADAFITNPCAGSQWTDLDAAMHAWQHWWQLDDDERNLLAFELNQVPIEAWMRTIKAARAAQHA